MTKQRIAVVGAGAIGSVAAAHLAKSNDICLIDNKAEKHLDAIASGGLTCIDGSEETTEYVDTARKINDIEETPDLVVIATKTFGLPHLVKELTHRFSKEELEGISVICMQNGYGNENYVAETLGTPTYRMAVNYVGKLTSPGTVNWHWLKKPNFIGSAVLGEHNQLHDIGYLFDSTGLSTKVVPDIRHPTFYKTILNASMSSVCAVTKKTMGEVMADPHLSTLVMNAVEEGLRVGEAIGLSYGSFEDVLEQSRRYLEAGGDHPTSMREDLWRYHQTEVEWFNEAIAREGKKTGIPTPYNTGLATAIRTLERTGKDVEKNIRNLL